MRTGDSLAELSAGSTLEDGCIDADLAVKFMRGRIPGDIPGREEENPEEVKSMRVASFRTV
jgi:hypothetical protein